MFIFFKYPIKTLLSLALQVISEPQVYVYINIKSIIQKFQSQYGGTHYVCDEVFK